LKYSGDGFSSVAWGSMDVESLRGTSPIAAGVAAGIAGEVAAGLGKEIAGDAATGALTGSEAFGPNRSSNASIFVCCAFSAARCDSSSAFCSSTRPRRSCISLSMAEASGFAAGLSAAADALLTATGVSSLPASVASLANSGDAARLMLSNTAANTRIPYPPEKVLD
jgi:hypothetical protein